MFSINGSIHLPLFSSTSEIRNKKEELEKQASLAHKLAKQISKLSGLLQNRQMTIDRYNSVGLDVVSCLIINQIIEILKSNPAIFQQLEAQLDIKGKDILIQLKNKEPIQLNHIHQGYVIDVDIDQVINISKNIIDMHAGNQYSWFTPDIHPDRTSPKGMLGNYLNDWINETKETQEIAARLEVAIKIKANFFNDNESQQTLDLNEYAAKRLLPRKVLDLIFSYYSIRSIDLRRCKVGVGESEKLINELCDYLADKRIKTLNLSDSINEIPVSIVKLKSLETLILCSMYPHSNPSLAILNQLPNLKNLDLTFVNLNPHEIPLDLKLDSLEILLIKNSDIKMLPNTFPNHFPNLRKLEISQCALTKVGDESLQSLQNLTCLSINSSNLGDAGIKKLLANLPAGIKELSLWLNLMTSFPEELFNYQGLIKLDLSYNDLQWIPDKLATLSNLQTLYLTKTGLTAFPTIISKLNSLVDLRLNSNQIKKIPEDAFSSTIEILDLAACGLKDFPKAISPLKSLKKLDLSGNNLENIPKGTLDQLARLESLDLSTCNLKSVPELNTSLQGIQKLNLSSNPKLQIADNAFFGYGMLKKLNLQHTNLAKIPDALAQLVNLEILVLNNNPIEINEELVKAITNLKQLKILHMQRVTIEDIEKGVKNILGLCKLNNLKLKIGSTDLAKEIRKQIEEINLEEDFGRLIQGNIS